MKSFLFKSFILFLFVSLAIGFLSPSNLSADSKKVWMDTGHWEAGYEYVEEWVPCDKTFVYEKYSRWYFSLPWIVHVYHFPDCYKGVINGNTYKYDKYYYFCDFFYGLNLIGENSNVMGVDVIDHDGTIISNVPFWDKVYKIEYKCFEVLTRKKVAYKKWVEEGHWEDYAESVWANEDDYDYEHEHKHVDSSLHGELVVKKDPEYVFTKWHKDEYNNECGMNLSISWKVDNSNLTEGEEEKKIVRLYIYEDVCRFDDKGIEKVIIFDGNVSPATEGNIDTVTKFEYSGSKESLLHIYLFDQDGESVHVYFSNPINGFRSINLMSEGSGTDANAWLGGISYEKFEF